MKLLEKIVVPLILSSCVIESQPMQLVKQAYERESQKSTKREQLTLEQATKTISNSKITDTYSYEFPSQNSSVEEFSQGHSRIYYDFNKDGYIDEVSISIISSFSQEPYTYSVSYKSEKREQMPKYRLVTQLSGNSH